MEPRYGDEMCLFYVGIYVTCQTGQSRDNTKLHIRIKENKQTASRPANDLQDSTQMSSRQMSGALTTSTMIINSLVFIDNRKI